MQEDRMFDKRQNADHAGSPLALTRNLSEVPDLAEGNRIPQEFCYVHLEVCGNAISET
jgi:hypothetical protein